MVILDHIDNIQFDESFPIKNLHALNYHTEGIYHLAKTVRENEINFYQLDSPAYQAIGGIENHNIIMNMFNWFSISIINYVRLVGFIDYVSKNNLKEKDLEEKTIKTKIKKYSNDYVKKIIPEIVQYRNKLSAHHSLVDPFHDDNLATLLTSSLNTIVYRKPYFESSFYIHMPNGKADIEPWILTKTYENLCKRYWPEISLATIPVNRTITEVYKGYKAEQENRQGDALSHYNKTINQYINSESLDVQVQVACSMLQRGVILENCLNYEEAINAYKNLVHKFDNIDNIDLQIQVAMAINNLINTLGEMKKYDESIAFTNQYYKKFNTSDNMQILTTMGKLMIAKGVRFILQGKTDKAIEAYDDVIKVFKGFSSQDLYLYEAQAYVNKAKLLQDLGLKNDAITTYNIMINKYEKNTSSMIQDQITRIKSIMIHQLK